MSTEPLNCFAGSSSESSSKKQQSSRSSVRFTQEPNIHIVRGGVEGGLHYTTNEQMKKASGIGSKTVRLKDGSPLLVSAHSSNGSLPSISKICQWVSRELRLDGEEYTYRHEREVEYMKLVALESIIRQLLTESIEERSQMLEAIIQENQVKGPSQTDAEIARSEAITLLGTYRNALFSTAQHPAYSYEKLRQLVFVANLGKVLVEVRNQVRIAKMTCDWRNELLQNENFRQCAALHDVFIAVEEKVQAGFIVEESSRCLRKITTATLSIFLGGLAKRDEAFQQAVKLFVMNTRGQGILSYAHSEAFITSTRALRSHIRRVEEYLSLCKIQKQADQILNERWKEMCKAGDLCTMSLVAKNPKVGVQFKNYLWECQESNGMIQELTSHILQESSRRQLLPLSFAREWLSSVIKKPNPLDAKEYLVPGEYAASSSLLLSNSSLRNSMLGLAQALRKSVVMEENQRSLIKKYAGSDSFRRVIVDLDRKIDTLTAFIEESQLKSGYHLLIPWRQYLGKGGGGIYSEREINTILSRIQFLGLMKLSEQLTSPELAKSEGLQKEVISFVNLLSEKFRLTLVSLSLFESKPIEECKKIIAQRAWECAGILMVERTFEQTSHRLASLCTTIADERKILESYLMSKRPPFSCVNFGSPNLSLGAFVAHYVRWKREFLASV